MTYPLTTLESIFRIVDMEGLIALGAPEDEYEYEAEEVQAGLEGLEEGGLTYARVSSIIMEIWQNSFGPFDENGLRRRQPVLQQLVRRILDQRPAAPSPVEVQPLPRGRPAPLRR